MLGKVMDTPGPDRDLLIDSAVAAGLPNEGFFQVLTPRRRRELIYTVKGECSLISVELEVHGSGHMKAYVAAPCTIIEDGDLDSHNDRVPVAWADNGIQAMIPTRLNHKHLEQPPCPKDVMRAFIEAIGLHTRASCAGGYRHWKAAMQLYARRIAVEHNAAIEIVVDLPLPHDILADQHRRQARRENAFAQVHDISDPERPRIIAGYEQGLTELDEAMTPEAMNLMLLLPGHLVRRRHTEIFHAG